MTRLRMTSICRLIAGFLFVSGASLPALEASGQGTQQIALTAGWNAIHLDIDPVDDAVEAVFDPQVVDVVARYFTPSTSVRFIEDPSEEAWNNPAWGVWYGPGRAEAFLTTLHAIQGGCAYLVHAKKDAVLNVTGAAKFRPLRWKVDSFNLTGFPVEGGAGMSFAKFFAGSGNKIGDRVYRLVKGSWQKVTNLAATPIRPGEACWVYCEGATTYQGPLELRMSGSSEITFSEDSSLSVIELRNRLNSPFSVEAALESNDGLPLYHEVVNLSDLTSASVPLGGNVSLGTLSAGGVTQFRLQLRHEQAGAASGSAVLKFSTSDGVVLRVPIHLRLP